MFWGMGRCLLSTEMRLGAAAVIRGWGCPLLACQGVRTLSTSAGSVWAWYEALSVSAPVAWTEAGLLTLQAASGLPWWSSIIAASTLLRTSLTLPLAAHQGHILAKLENLQPEIQSLAKQLRQEVSICAKQRSWSENMARFHFRKNLKRIVSELYVRDNCHPLKASLLIWIQIPVWVFVSIALRNFSIGRPTSEGFSIQEQLSTGGTLWFTDLTAPDPTLVLPIALGLLNLLIVEMFVLRKTELSRFQKYSTYFFRGMAILMVPIAATVPSAMALYWVSSSFVGLSHNLLLRSPAFRRICRIPRTKSDSDTPYKDILDAFCAKYFLK
ncbi:cytochrome c oxidase assembly protein COX18, mitochondrial [Eublepharis macularius]|uniref:Cytochrome c oxidase assembly protein COX18, mitochondrial n=1 Tax=Eublepharis macularius TaxID=481883 RepID=A0AA97LCN5_EUBMA|nr:cytochrome c oxidase assembly protein COX18, mitochondrial [Eublepharis macularius]XP_054847578.1 cytochrome c oxidase assembly protein COX18, mitochondrial [Eublepharis macularius]